MRLVAPSQPIRHRGGASNAHEHASETNQSICVCHRSNLTRFQRCNGSLDTRPGAPSTSSVVQRAGHSYMVFPGFDDT